jgi:hypothetical protein
VAHDWRLRGNASRSNRDPEQLKSEEDPLAEPARGVLVPSGAAEQREHGGSCHRNGQRHTAGAAHAGSDLRLAETMMVPTVAHANAMNASARG